MNRAKVMSVLLVALLAGGGLAAATYSYLQNVPVKTVTAPTRTVVVARGDLTLGSELRADDLKTVEWPASAVPEGAFSNPSELVGRGLIASVVRSEPILPGKIASKEAGSGLPPLIPPGKRAVSVRVNDVISVAGYTLPGTFVDVVATASPTARPQDTTSKIVLANVQVLTAGTRLEHDQKDGKPVQVTVVTLLVTPEEAERLALASSSDGNINLALRNPFDRASPPTPGIRPDVLLGTPQRREAGARMPRSPYTPPPPPTVEIIRGDKREKAIVG